MALRAGGENPSMPFELISSLEEFLEMTALVVLLNALFRHLISILPPQGVTINGSNNQLWIETQEHDTLLKNREPEQVLTGASHS